MLDQYKNIGDDLFCGDHLIMALLSFHIMLFLESVNRELRSFEGAKPLHWWFVGSFHLFFHQCKLT
jgi:hypothetical protein